MSSKIKPGACESFEPLLIDYLENNLGQSDRNKVEDHLKHCESCRQNLRQQQEWLKLLPSAAAQNIEGLMPEGMNERIMAAIRHEAATRSIHEKSRKPLLHTPVFWYRAVSAAAAVIVLIAALQVFQGLNIKRSNLESQEAVGRLNSDFSTEYADNFTVVDTNSEDASTGKSVVEGASGIWQLYSGSISDLPAADCLFTSDNGTPETAASTDASAHPAQRGILDLLGDAKDLLVLTSAGEPERTLILAAYPSVSIESNVKQIKNALTTCITPVEIEIIMFEDIPNLQNTFGPDLYESVFERLSSSQSWICILIGE